MRRLWAHLCAASVAASLAGAAVGQGQVVEYGATESLTFGPMDTLRVNLRPSGQGGGFGTRGDCPETITYSGANFEGGSFVIQAGFPQQATAAVQYVLSPDRFPLRVDLMEMIFAGQNLTTQTVTEWTILVWDGPPSTGTLVFEFSSDDLLLPHIRLGPGTAGVNVQVSIDPSDPEQIIINNVSGTNSFTVGYRIDRHNSQTQNPCFFGPPPTLNVFPTTDTNGLNFGTRSWLQSVDCGILGCTPGTNWIQFSAMRTGCRPSGDWNIRATFSPFTCPGAIGACCLAAGTVCIPATLANCSAAGGTWAGEGSTCADLNGNGQADFCEPANPPCVGDWDRNGEVEPVDIRAFFDAYRAGEADADGNGETEPVDIRFFFDAYRAGC